MQFFNINILPKLNNLIKEKCLTELLETLEHLGYYGDESVTLLAYLQQEVEA